MKTVLRYLAVVTVIAFTVRWLGFESARISSNSMSPNLLLGDWVLLTKFDYNLHLPFSAFELVRFRNPARGEIIAFGLPDRGMELFVKRVVGVAGDTLALKKGVLFVNGRAVTHSTEGQGLSLETIPGAPPFSVQIGRSATEDYGPIDVPPDHFFVLSDNRNDRSDSRAWGPIPSSCISGKVKLVFVSLTPAGALRERRSGLRLP